MSDRIALSVASKRLGVTLQSMFNICKREGYATYTDEEREFYKGTGRPPKVMELTDFEEYQEKMKRWQKNREEL